MYMKKNYEIYIFIALQICLVLSYIYKESRYIEAFYQNQRLEKSFDELQSQAKDLQHQLQALQNRSAIQNSAQQQGLEPLSLSHVRNVHAHEST